MLFHDGSSDITSSVGIIGECYIPRHRRDYNIAERSSKMRSLKTSHPISESDCTPAIIYYSLSASLSDIPEMAETRKTGVICL